MRLTLLDPLRQFGRLLVGLPGVHHVAETAPTTLVRLRFRRRRPQVFMDVIRLPNSTEDLRLGEIQDVNRLRRPLIDDSTSAEHATNRRVKQAMAAGLGAAGVTSVLDWGCGYHPMSAFLEPGVEYVGVDIDPDVVREVGRTGTRCLDPDDAVVEFDQEPFSAIVSVFVFHFKLPHAHIRAMTHLIGTDGFILANVYRRSGESRKRLKNAFQEQGLRVDTEPDVTRAATGNEFWFIAAPTVADNLADKVLHTVSASMQA